jgi:hypothetical protein
VFPSEEGGMSLYKIFIVVYSKILRGRNWEIGRITGIAGD